jgi:hypothetical protein
MIDKNVRLFSTNEMRSWGMLMSNEKLADRNYYTTIFYIGGG